MFNVYDVMWDADAQTIEARNVNKKKKKPKKQFTSDGPNWTLSLDGQDKMIGFQNCTFPQKYMAAWTPFQERFFF